MTAEFDSWLANDRNQVWLSVELPHLVSKFWTWVDRRVETIELISDTRFDRHISIDLTVPQGTPVGPYARTSRLLPLAFVRKTYLRAFNITDETGRSLAILTERQVIDATSAMLRPRILAQLEKEGARLGWSPAKIFGYHDGLIGGLDQLLTNKADKGDVVIADLKRNGIWFLVLKDDLIAQLIEELAVSFILLTVIDANEGERRIIKYKYSHRFKPPQEKARLGEGVLRWLGWRPLTLTIDGVVPAASASFHAEVAAPPGSVLAASELIREKEQLDFDNHDPRIAHLRYSAAQKIAEKPDAKVVGNAKVVLQMWPAKNEVLRQVSRGAHLVPVVLLAGIIIREPLLRPWIAGLNLNFEPQAASPVLVAVPAVVAFYLAVQEHSLLSRLLSGTLMRAGIAAGVAFVAAASLTLTNYQAHGLLRLWELLFVVALLNSVSLAIGRRTASRLWTDLRQQA